MLCKPVLCVWLLSRGSLKVTLCCTVVSFHTHVTIPPRRRLTSVGANAVPWTCTEAASEPLPVPVVSFCITPMYPEPSPQPSRATRSHTEARNMTEPCGQGALRG